MLFSTNKLAYKRYFSWMKIVKAIQICRVKAAQLARPETIWLPYIHFFHPVEFKSKLFIQGEKRTASIFLKFLLISLKPGVMELNYPIQSVEKFSA